MTGVFKAHYGYMVLSNCPVNCAISYSLQMIFVIKRITVIMMKCSRRYIFPFIPALHAMLLAVMLLCIWRAGTAQALTVDDVRFGVHGDKVRMVFDLSEMSDFKAFALTAPDRLVVDLPDFAWQAGSVSKPPGALVRHIRTGTLKPGISRVVFDLSGPVSIRSAFLLPRASGKPDRLVIDYSAASRFSAGKVLGTLHTGVQDNVRSASVSAPSAAMPSPGGAPPLASNEKPMIVIDAGHGGQDPGAVAAGKLFEKNITLAAARELRKQLLATGRYRVQLTRDSDVFLKLAERVRKARAHDADLFISIHADSIRNSGVRGASIYTLSEKASDAQTAKLAERENRADLIGGLDLRHEDQDVAKILVDLSMRETMNQSKFLANTIVGKLGRGGIRLLPNTHRYAGFAVLKAPDIPSVLVEIGFMSNRREAGLLNRPDHRRKIAASLVDGIDAYFERVRRHQRT
jgi:N-acetylmuramoyl-L-alanine amidase